VPEFNERPGRFDLQEPPVNETALEAEVDYQLGKRGGEQPSGEDRKEGDGNCLKCGEGGKSVEGDARGLIRPLASGRRGCAVFLR